MTEENVIGVLNRFVDVVVAWVIGPAKVVRSAMENAASDAPLLLTTFLLTSDTPILEKPTTQK